jgi:hypothetical protein
MPVQPPAGQGKADVFGQPLLDFKNTVLVYELAEGSVKIPWGKTAGGRYDVYRSDNGAAYVKMNDFLLTEPVFMDRYAFYGHSYVYILVTYAADGRVTYSSPVKINVVKAKPKLSIELAIDSLKAVVNGRLFTLETAPLILDNRTMVPLRFIGEALGATVQWNEALRAVTLKLGDRVIVLGIGSSVVSVNGQEVVIDVPAQIVGGTTMVPLRFVSESLLLAITFDDATRKIFITGDLVGGSGGGSTGGIGGIGGGLPDGSIDPPIGGLPGGIIDDPIGGLPDGRIPPSPTSSFPDPLPDDEDDFEFPDNRIIPPDEEYPTPALGGENMSFIGTWDLWVPGGSAWKAGDANESFKPGDFGGLLRIKEDYTWTYGLGENMTSGTWSPIKNSDEILLSNFEYDSDWQVRWNRGRFQVYTFGMYFEGTKVD